MGFLLSKIYREAPLEMLVLKPSQAKRYTVVEEFFPFLGAECSVLFKYASECFAYTKVVLAGKSVSVLEMHNQESLDFFWDCFQGMHSVVYFVEEIHEKAIPEVLFRLEIIKQTHKHAVILLVVVSVLEPLDVYVSFKRQVKHLLEGNEYKIIDGADHTIAPQQLLTKESICQGFSWMIKQIK
ncbi:ADP-ribosylation factor related protein 1 [Nematocida sp. AWRm77]|nr:ADP-ribosylation factor related protein 1 [Nematocida sp. AWRm77]